ncbi:MAG: hypothetical protein AABZ14_03900 [Candidatus Margulisiibacteriota bacterium]
MKALLHENFIVDEKGKTKGEANTIKLIQEGETEFYFGKTKKVRSLSEIE